MVEDEKEMQQAWFGTGKFFFNNESIAQKYSAIQIDEK